MRKGWIWNLNHITILVGPNGAGKSNILKALALFVQSRNTIGLDYKGSYYYSQVSFPSPEDIFYKLNPNNWITIEVHTVLEDEEEKNFWECGERLVNFMKNS